MHGDRLASGARAASFPQGKRDATEKPAAGMTAVEVRKSQNTFECKDCGGVFDTAKEFCGHECGGAR